MKLFKRFKKEKTRPEHNRPVQEGDEYNPLEDVDIPENFDSWENPSQSQGPENWSQYPNHWQDEEQMNLSNGDDVSEYGLNSEDDYDAYEYKGEGQSGNYYGEYDPYLNEETFENNPTNTWDGGYPENWAPYPEGEPYRDEIYDSHEKGHANVYVDPRKVDEVNQPIGRRSKFHHKTDKFLNNGIIVLSILLVIVLLIAFIV